MLRDVSQGSRCCLYIVLAPPLPWIRSQHARLSKSFRQGGTRSANAAGYYWLILVLIIAGRCWALLGVAVHWHTAAGVRPYYCEYWEAWEARRN